MNRRAELFAWSLVVLACLLVVGAAVVSLSAGSSLSHALSEISGVGLVFAIGFPVLGALVIRRTGSHLVGWLMLGMGVSLAFQGVVEQWSQTALVDDPGSLVLGDLSSWFAACAIPLLRTIQSNSYASHRSKKTKAVFVRADR